MATTVYFRNPSATPLSGFYFGDPTQRYYSTPNPTPGVVPKSVRVTLVLIERANKKTIIS